MGHDEQIDECRYVCAQIDPYHGDAAAAQLTAFFKLCKARLLSGHQKGGGPTPLFLPCHR